MSAVQVDYDFAVLRVVPRVHLGAFVNVGVVVHARTAEFLALRAVTDERVLATHVRGVDAELLARYLRSCEAICAGDAAAGPMALAPPSERFHWLTAPRVTPSASAMRIALQPCSDSSSARRRRPSRQSRGGASVVLMHHGLPHPHLTV